jgi:phosphoglycolate phosphatase
VAIIIFDFDGTIANTLDAIVRIANRLANEFGHSPITPEEVKRLQGLNTQEIIQYSGLSVFKFARLLGRVRKELRSEIETITIVPGLEPVLRELSQHHKLGILTSNSADNVSQFLNRYQIADQFDFIYSGVSVFGKARVLRRTLKRYRFPADQVIYVGDETRDIDAARSIPITIAAVGWGFNTAEALSQRQPDILIHQPEELLTLNLRSQLNPSNN